MLLAVPTSINTNIISDIAAHAVPTQKAILSECPCPCLSVSPTAKSAMPRKKLMPRKSKEFISAPATPCLCRGTFVVMKTLETLYVMSTPTVEPIMAGKTNAQRFTLVKGYLAYAPTELTDYQPNGYAFTFPLTPDSRVDITRDNGTATPDVIKY